MLNLKNLKVITLIILVLTILMHVTLTITSFFIDPEQLDILTKVNVSFIKLGFATLIILILTTVES